MPWIGGYGRKCVLTGVSRHRCQGEPAHPWYLEFRAPGVANARVNSGQRVSGMGASQHDMGTLKSHTTASFTLGMGRGSGTTALKTQVRESGR